MDKIKLFKTFWFKTNIGIQFPKITVLYDKFMGKQIHDQGKYVIQPRTKKLFIFTSKYNTIFWTFYITLHNNANCVRSVVLKHTIIKQAFILPN